MVGKKILIISEKGKGFIENSLEFALKKDDFEVSSLSYMDDNINENISLSDAVFWVVGDNVEKHTITLNMIKNGCLQYRKPVFVHCTKDMLMNIDKVFEEKQIAGCFLRSVEVSEVVFKVNNYFREKAIKKKVLVVDDSGIMLRTIMGWLENDYEVSLANSAEIAYMSIQKNMPDLILLDYEMPVCSGAQFMERLKGEEWTKNIPIIFLTSRDDAETVNEVLRLKPVGYILKTSSSDKVLDAIADYFKKKR